MIRLSHETQGMSDAESPSASSPGTSPKGELAQRFTVAPNVDPSGAQASVESKFKVTSFDKQLVDLDLSERMDFFRRPLPEGTFMHCFIVREKTGVTKWNRRFVFKTDAGTFLGVAKRVGGISKRPYYLVSIDDTDMRRDGRNYAGKVRWNFKGTAFTAFDGGENAKNVVMLSPTSTKSGLKMPNIGKFFGSPKSTATDTDKKSAETAEEDDDFSDVRAQHAFVAYTVPYNGPISMEFVLPHVDEKGERTVIRPLIKGDPGLVDLVHTDSQETTKEGPPKVVRYITPPQQWREDLGYYVQNFTSRVKLPSVKNFLMVRPEDESTVYMQFGKVSEDYFAVDFGHPLSPYQAFSIALTSLDYKIASVI